MIQTKRGTDTVLFGQKGQKHERVRMFWNKMAENLAGRKQTQYRNIWFYDV